MISIKNTAIHHTSTGEGPLMLFLHGVPDTLMIWWGVIERLAPDFRCLATALATCRITGGVFQ